MPAPPLNLGFNFLTRHWIVCVLVLVPTSVSFGVSVCEQPDAIDNLIQDLNSPRFATRESATHQLVNLGEKSLRPLINNYFGASTESAWRIKNVLREIGLKNDELTTSFKSIGILIVLEQTDSWDLVELMEDWVQSRSDKALAFVIAKGAKLDSFEPESADIRMAEIRRFGPQVILGNGRGQVLPINPSRNTPTKAPRREPLDPKEKYALLLDILKGDLEENEKTIWGLYEENVRNSGATSSKNIGPYGDANSSPALFPFGGMMSRALVIDDAWRGNANDLRQIGYIRDLGRLHFVGRRLESEEVTAISKMFLLNHIGLWNCSVVGKRLSAITIPQNIKSILIGDTKIDLATTKWLTEQNLQVIKIDHCTLTGEAVNQFSKFRVATQLNLTRIKLSKVFFEQTAKMPMLRSLSLSVCKFDPDDLRDFKQEKPGCNVDFVPIAFLGVRGPNPRIAYRGDTECLIEEVILGSSADKAGIQEGDVITKVNQHPITEFEELRMFVSQVDVSDRLVLTINRNGKSVKLEVRLGSIADSPDQSTP